MAAAGRTDSLTTLSHFKKGDSPMPKTLHVLYRDEHGFIVSAELVLVLTIAVLAMVVGLHAVAKSVTTELNDLANAFGTINQSYAFNGFDKPDHSWTEGASFRDRRDDCDCTEIIQSRPDAKVDPSSRRSESR